MLRQVSRTHIRLACLTWDQMMIMVPLYFLSSWLFLSACLKHHYLSRIVSDRIEEKKFPSFFPK